MQWQTALFCYKMRNFRKEEYENMNGKWHGTKEVEIKKIKGTKNKNSNGSSSTIISMNKTTTTTTTKKAMKMSHLCIAKWHCDCEPVE